MARRASRRSEPQNCLLKEGGLQIINVSACNGGQLLTEPRPQPKLVCYCPRRSREVGAFPILLQPIKQTLPPHLDYTS